MWGFGNDEARLAREEARWKAAWQGTFNDLRARALAAAPFDPTSKCPKCGGAALPRFVAALTKFEITVPEHIAITCGCGFHWPMKPRDASATDALAHYSLKENGAKE